MKKTKEKMWLKLVVTLMFLGAMTIVAPQAALALSQEELSEVVAEIKQKEESGEVSSEEATTMLEELKEGIEKGDIAYSEGEKGEQEQDIAETLLDDPQERAKAAEQMQKDKEKILAEGQITPEEFDKVLQTVREETDPEKFAAVMKEVFEKGGLTGEDHNRGEGGNEDRWKEFLGPPVETERGLDALREVVEKQYGDKAEERFREIGLEMEREMGQIDFEKMTPDQQREMAEKMGVTKEEFEKYQAEGHEAMERMARESGFDREAMERMAREAPEHFREMDRETMEREAREMMERERAEFERPPAGDYRDFMPPPGGDYTPPPGG